MSAPQTLAPLSQSDSAITIFLAFTTIAQRLDYDFLDIFVVVLVYRIIPHALEPWLRFQCSFVLVLLISRIPLNQSFPTETILR